MSLVDLGCCQADDAADYPYGALQPGRDADEGRGDSDMERLVPEATAVTRETLVGAVTRETCGAHPHFAIPHTVS
eukprot:SAG11_NODE_5768_length_1467_cov_1.254386_1_plen_75_part_00